MLRTEVGRSIDQDRCALALEVGTVARDDRGAEPARHGGDQRVPEAQAAARLSAQAPRFPRCPSGGWVGGDVLEGLDEAADDGAVVIGPSGERLAYDDLAGE